MRNPGLVTRRLGSVSAAQFDKVLHCSGLCLRSVGIHERPHGQDLALATGLLRSLLLHLIAIRFDTLIAESAETEGFPNLAGHSAGSLGEGGEGELGTEDVCGEKVGECRTELNTDYLCDA